MSKQSDAKERQGYVKRVIPMVCSNCVHYKSVITEREGIFGGTYKDESGMRCGLGGFSVQKTGGCNEHIYLDDGKK